METNREDFGIAIRSAFLKKGTQQRFSLLVLVIFSVALLFLDKTTNKPISAFRSLVKDVIFRSSVITTYPSKSFTEFINFSKNHINLYKKYSELRSENENLKNKVSESDFLLMENKQLRKLLDEEVKSANNNVSARVMIDKKSPYLNSFIINVGGNKKVKNGMAVLSGENFIGRIVDVNFFSSRVLLVSDLNSRIPILTQPSIQHAILNGRGTNEPTLEYLPKIHTIKDGDKVYTSGKEGIFSPGIPIGEVQIEKDLIKVLLFSDLSQITFVNIDLGGIDNNK